MGFLLFSAFCVLAVVYLNYKKTVAITPLRLKHLVCGMLVYMVVPSALFVLTLPVPGALILGFCLLISYYSVKALRYCAQGELFCSDDGYEVRLDYILLFFGLLILSYDSMFYGRGFLWDWQKNRSVLLCLHSNPLSPVLNYFAEPQDINLRSARLVYYYAMYLPGVFAVKAFTFFRPVEDVKLLASILSYSYFLWNLLGLLLAVLLLPAACRRVYNIKNSNVWGYFYPLLLLYSPMSYLRPAYSNDKLELAYRANWGAFWDTWSWVPSQLIPALFAVLLLFLYRARLDKFPLLLWSTFIIASSAFVWIGIVPIAVFFLFSGASAAPSAPGGRGGFRAFIYAMKAELPWAILIAAVIVLFYLSKVDPVALKLNSTLAMENGYLRYFVFVLTQLLPAGTILLLCRFKKITVPAVVWLSIGILILLPLFEMGFLNDLCLKSSIPANLIIMVFCCIVIQHELTRLNALTAVMLTAYFIMVIPGFIVHTMTVLVAQSQFLEYGVTISRQYCGVDNIWQFLR